MIKAVLFDLDGTMLDRHTTLQAFLKNQHSRITEFKHIPEKMFLDTFTILDDRGYVWKDIVYQKLIEEWNIQGLSAEELLQDYLENFPRFCIAFPRLFETLQKLRQMGMKLGVITNGKSGFQLANIKALGIEGFFDSILVSETVGMRKPNQEIFHLAATYLEVEPHQCLFVGDHPVNDVRAAESAGMTGVWKRDAFWGECKAQIVVEELYEILDYLNRREQ
ncbi:HAD-IA family hydrolase [Bacillus lacus]|uniref:HAD-IA family hydrolase n=1 Tax=Metabacillus lacus TaxID=1983721 RepID=A0A7X2IY71_9BACI|nr:HAD family hydrolase [Metabacillus lacus]MRX71861.1 HAD-IA family hydrolase [Metabacillus lacus]